MNRRESWNNDFNMVSLCSQLESRKKKIHQIKISEEADFVGRERAGIF